MSDFKFSPVDFFFTCVGLVFMVGDVVVDAMTVAMFYQEGAYGSLAALLLFLLGSSVLVQAFSWLWYSYEDFRRDTWVERYPSVAKLRVLHLLQMGIYLRNAGVIEMWIQRFVKKHRDHEGFAVYLSHDLSMLRLIETFSESSPQLVLMLTIMLQRRELYPIPVLKTFGSACCIAISITMYHRSLRSFLPEKAKQQVLSSLVYFVWNLFLISSRLVALTLFASVLPCFVAAHFLCSWVILFFQAWWCQTAFMDSAVGEWLYRATVGIIWYFAWFNVVEGKTRNRMLVYHGYKLADIFLLCGLWYWKMTAEPPYFEIPHLNAAIVAVVVAVYLLGLALKMVYYRFFHPNLTMEELKEVTTDTAAKEELQIMKGDEADSVPSNDIGTIGLRLKYLSDGSDDLDRGADSPPAPVAKRCNKRMQKLAGNFYT